MKGFRLIALKTGAEQKRFITIPDSNRKIDPYKVLKTNTVYPFYANYSFPNNDFRKVFIDNSKSVDLYSLDIENHRLQVNISAIVGKNGSGKSSLIELLYLATYNIGCSLKLLRDVKNNRFLKGFKDLELELLYALGQKFFIVSFDKGSVVKRQVKINKDGLVSNFHKPEYFTILDFREYFYTITINYSHYGLNATEVGKWINSLFHKNDGYQTPIVLNPMRTDGNINIKRENQLLKRRLQANLLQNINDQNPNDSLRNIANNKIAVSIEASYNKTTVDKFEENRKSNSQLRDNITTLIQKIFDFQISKNVLETDMFINLCIDYICNKLYKIANNYKPYNKYLVQENSSKVLRNLNAFINHVYNSNSHIFFKVKGAILYIKYYDRLFSKEINIKSKTIVFDIEKYSKIIDSIILDEKTFVNTYMLAPPSFFDTNIVLNDGTNIDSLSSGEKQKMHSVSSIIYHLINLNSVSDYNLRIDPKNRFHSYRYLNIVLDEIELYYHPDWQRTYINDLLGAISKINKSNISYIQGLNIVFLTHSPYILSDIPVTNVLKLDEGKPFSSIDEPQTYGANIYDLLTDSFFLGKYYIGEKARLDIEKIINTLRSTKDKIIEPYFNEKPQEIKKRIEIISEDFLRTKLLQMYFNKYENDKAYQRELLLKQLRDLEN